MFEGEGLLLFKGTGAGPGGQLLKGAGSRGSTVVVVCSSNSSRQWVCVLVYHLIIHNELLYW